MRNKFEKKKKTKYRAITTIYFNTNTRNVKPSILLYGIHQSEIRERRT